MGLFDRILREVTNKVVDAATGDVKKSVSDSFGSTSNGVTNNSYSIPVGYDEFPRFNGNMEERPTENNRDNYRRVTVKYNRVTSESVEDYRRELTNAGYEKGSNVRYDKGNTYVIVEENGGYLKIVYHVKK